MMLSEFPLLKSISLYGCDCDTDFTSLMSLKHLVTLRFDRLLRYSDFVTTLLELTNLTELSIGFNRCASFTDDAWAKIGQFTNLEKLTLVQCPYQFEPYFTELINWPRLTHLCLTDLLSINSFIGKLTTLRYLVIGDRCATEITVLTNLETLMLDTGPLCRTHDYHGWIPTSEILKLPKLRRFGTGHYPLQDEILLAPALEEQIFIVGDITSLGDQSDYDPLALANTLMSLRPSLRCRFVERPCLPYYIAKIHESEDMEIAWETWNA
jgi:hypothetical protein